MARKYCRFSFLFFLFWISSNIFSCAPTQEAELDRITALPGQPPVDFAQFSGYVTVHEEHGRALFYWLTEAASDSSRKPLVLWLNGGPGCSSIAYGASEEIGPFRVNRTGSSLYFNKYSWNKEANVLFLESPAGVGFSYTNTSSDLLDSGDERTAQDALNFLIRWFSRFPKFKYREFYISGESYAGHYVPQLAKKILDFNKAHSKPFIDLKGFLVGNAVTDNHYDSVGTVTYWWTHAMISDATYRAIMADCSFADADSSAPCNSALNDAMNREMGSIDQYSIYTPTCAALTATSSHATRPLIRLKNSLLRRRTYGYDPCTVNYAEKYYNRMDVQEALHANNTAIPYNWTACSDVLLRNWQDSQFSLLPTYKELIAAGLSIWMFSGDTDSVVPVTATRFALNHLNLTIKTRWYPWYCRGEVGGWTEIYEGLTFATVRGAGHEVPLFQPRRAFRLFQSFLAGQNLPTT